MLTEKMIFVDNTATQFNLTDSMGSETSQPSDARSGLLPVSKTLC